ncbi:MAG: hypothetical protein GXO69_07835 [Acidobacteria bacterium]|nr:hypothetical protein [Acidobacteriota bacterium]
MKSLLSVLIMTGLILVPVNTSCVVRARAVVPVPAVTVHYRVVSGRRVLVVPRAVRPGHVIIINGRRCVVKSRRGSRVKVVYPNGRVVWVESIYR